MTKALKQYDCVSSKTLISISMLTYSIEVSRLGKPGFSTPTQEEKNRAWPKKENLSHV